MDAPSLTRLQRVCQYGPSLAKLGAIISGLAMVLGFLVALAMHWFADPENPTPLYGKIFAGVLALFTLGIITIVLGLLTLLCASPPSQAPAVRKPPRAEPAETEDDEHTDRPEQSTPDLPQRSWEEAYSASRRRRL